MSKFGVSQPVRRLEDLRFLTGEGRYVDDINVERQVYACVVRSSVAHGRILGLNTDSAKRLPGIVDIITAEELEARGANALSCEIPLKNRDGSRRANPARPVLASGRVRYVGDPVAFVVAESREQARDAGERVELEVDPMEAVTRTDTADAEDAPRVHDEVRRNLIFDWEFGDEQSVKLAMESAAYRVELRLVNNRVVANSMEPRGALADIDTRDGTLTLYTNTQGVWEIHAIIAESLGLDPQQVRVVTPDVGGGFGMKGVNYPEQVLTAYAAHKLGRPVKWCPDRSEAFLSDTMGRDHVTRAALGFDEDHRVVAMAVDTRANMGAYLSDYAPFIPTVSAVKVLSGVYDVKRLHYRVRGVATNTTPVDAYRGAGRPESIFVIERLMDESARALGTDAVTLRRKNLITAGSMPFKTAAGEVYDCGNFAAVMDAALARGLTDGFPARRREAQTRGKLRGLGLCCYIESTMGWPEENAEIRFRGDGLVEVLVGTQSSGQGHETAYAQLVHQSLGVPFDGIRVIQGDTARITQGGGTGGSRSLTAQGWAIGDAVEAVIERSRRLASERLEAAVEDVEFESGRFRIVGTDRAITLLALARSFAEESEATGSHPMNGQASVKIADWAFPNGCHLAEVEISPETGQLEIVNYTVVDDFGNVINPLLLEGQVHGGVVQGAGQALMECAVYDDAGQLLTGSFMDYCMPRAADFPFFDFNTLGVPTLSNPLGIKGCGEAGAVGSTAAVANAVHDALAVAGVGPLDMPFTP
ncbi:MAG TPA: xanthine dehydrogenase family protein molybdopterin-binding subunit, partial [Gammaproteobacteria bacterium]|nr:xanthine dehydrogenase family protein molybdopterin-binding subunit [Gammaproteobacteria bacterium]